MKKIFTTVAISCLSLMASAGNTVPLQDTNFPAKASDGHGVARFSEINGELYAPSANGIYKMTFESGAESLPVWSLFAMEGMNVLDFKKADDMIIAIVAPGDSPRPDHEVARLYRLNLTTSDVRDVTAAEMEYESDGHILTYMTALAQNPGNPLDIMVATSGGIMRSKDFGATWTIQSDYSYVLNPHQFFGWHPYQKGILLHASEGPIFNAVVVRSGNDGEDWELIEPSPYDGDNAAHDIAFDADNYNHLLMSGQGRIWESFDSGKSFTLNFKNDKLLFAYNVMFNPLNHAEAYCVGCNGSGDIAIFKSTDHGHSWMLDAEARQPEGSSWIVSDCHPYHNSIYIYTNRGIFTYDMTGSSGVTDIVNDRAAGERRFYNLQGVRLPAPPDGGMYIERNGTEVTKHIGGR